MNLKALEILNENLKWNITLIESIENLGGLSNENYKVIYDKETYFLRICPTTYLHTNRPLELNIINKASSIGLCKKPIYYSLADGTMVSPWIEGSMPKEEAFINLRFINELTKKLKALHSLNCESYFNPFEHIRKGISLCKAKEISLLKSITQILDTFSKLEVKLKENLTLGLCHNDLNASNIILNKNRIFFIDYEFSSMGDIFFDLATLSWFLDEPYRKQLLKIYFGFYRAEDYEKLLDYLYIVKLHNAIWSLLKSTEGNSTYDFFKGANLIFEDLLNY